MGPPACVGPDPLVVRRSKSQGSHRTNRRLSKCYSMAQGSLGSEEESTPPSPAVSSSAAPGGPSKSHLLLLSRQYYSFGSNVIPGNYQPGWFSSNSVKMSPSSSLGFCCKSALLPANLLEHRNYGPTPIWSLSL